MPQRIGDEAQISCSFGTASSSLKVTFQNFCTVNGKLVATEADKEANVNIKPFGQCKLKGYLPCIPCPGNWQTTTEIDCINNMKILTEESFCMCSIGGKVSFDNNGHMGKHSIG